MRCDILFLEKIFPSILFRSDDGSIHLTFDDGPHPIATPIVLQELKSYGIQATFFILGQNAEKYPDIVRKIHAEGHQIGNHSYSHQNLVFKSKYFIRDEILKTKKILDETIGTHSKYFRPPYGYFNWTTLQVLREQGLTCTLWNVDSKDYKLNSAVAISDRINQDLLKGSVILCHDNDLTSQKVGSYLPNLLDILKEKEFIFKVLPI